MGEIVGSRLAVAVGSGVVVAGSVWVNDGVEVGAGTAELQEISRKQTRTVTDKNRFIFFPVRVKE